MVITAKFASVCPVCGGRIAVGTSVEWSKGERAAHVACKAGAAAPVAPKAAKAAPAKSSLPSVTEAPYVRYEKWAPCKRVNLRSAVGTVLISTESKRAPWAVIRQGAEGSDVREIGAFVVVAQTERWESQEANEDYGDMSGAGWQVQLYLRRATEAEAAPVIAKAATERAAKEAAATRSRQIETLRRLCAKGWCGSDEDANKPAGESIEVAPGIHGAGQIVAILSPAGTAVATWCGGFYDDYRQSLCVTSDPQAIAIMRSLLGR